MGTSVNNFASDNVSCACPEVMQALVRANTGTAPSYGEDPWTTGLCARLSEIFETPVTAFPVTTGTAANALALSALTPSFGKIFCHELSHINTDECGAPEMFTGGAKLIDMKGIDGRISAQTLEQVIYGRGNVHHAQPSAVSITQACESGTVYPLDEIKSITSVARAHQLPVHMDGARFANALVTLGITPAQMTWQAGIDVLSFGGTKNGCLAAEVVIFFKPELVGDFPFLQKRAGQLLSKSRFISAQFEGYLADDVWLHNGLSDLGKEAISEMNRWGIMIDISHPSKEAIMQMIELSTAPVMASHSSARSLNDVSRNLDDEQLKAVQANGGVGASVLVL